MLEYAHCWFFLLGVFQQLGYLLVLASQQYPIQTISWGILSVLYVIFLSQYLWCFQKGFWSGDQTFPVVPARAGLSVLSDLLSYFRSCCQIFGCLTPRLVAFLLSSRFSQNYRFSWVLSKFLRSNAPWLHVTSWEVWSIPYFVPVSWQRRFWRSASLIYYVVFSVAVFHSVLWGGEDKIEVLEEICSNVLWGFYYQLTLSCSDFAKCRTH